MFPGLSHRFEIIKSIGGGGFSDVFLATHKASQLPVSIKQIHKSGISNVRTIKNEIDLQMSFNHISICPLFEVIENDKSIFLIMEYLPNGSLYQRICVNGCFSEPIARKYFRQIVLALDYLHQSGICHRDLKPENVMFDQFDNVRIIDFGMARVHQEGGPLMTTMCGSPHYSSPEVTAGKGYTKSTDIWSLGVLLYVTCSATMPFSGGNPTELIRNIHESEVSYPQSFSPELIDLLQKMLVKDQDKRITLEQIKEHPWVVCGTGKLLNVQIPLLCPPLFSENYGDLDGEMTSKIALRIRLAEVLQKSFAPRTLQTLIPQHAARIKSFPNKRFRPNCKRARYGSTGLHNIIPPQILI